MSSPFEIVAAPYSVYLAPVGTAFPVLPTAPAVAWILVGTSGPNVYTEDGVTILHNQEFEPVRVMGHAFPAKLLPTIEDVIVRVTLYDLTLETWSISHNFNTVTSAAGPPATKSMFLERGDTIRERALLVRGPSPYDDAVNMQLELPKVVQTGSAEVQIRRNAPAGLMLEFTAFGDLSKAAGERLGRIIALTAAP